jgi:uncharacterized protein (DUF1697 family)
LSARQIVLLRGINLGPTNRVRMPALREVLGDRGFERVSTYLQSGNVVLSSDLSPTQVTAECKAAMASAFGLDIDVLVRTRDELAMVIARNPLAKVADNPKRYQVTFLEHGLSPEAVEALTVLCASTERVVTIGREVYAWHPEGVARSRLWARLGGKSLGVAGTSRNWTTVTALLEMADV